MPASDPIDFYFDFSSPYGYLAATRINAIGAKYERRVKWRPILLGPAFKASGNSPLNSQPLKGAYAERDFRRTARFMGVPYKQPDPFPIGTQNAARAFYWIDDRDPLQAHRFAMTCFATYFAQGIDISSAEKVAELAAHVGLDREEILAVVSDPAVKDRLKREVEASLQKGVFGSPYIIVDGEPFWGSDRLDQVQAWLDTGGF
ncbi:MAG: 2-hydroxychromene-2-carboxylate isomerase [Betaproteobacteria bacterium]|jgi:2-hydroxychromene-2-carboxylate isomerase|nr:2-hydroxychromene-2-carboxylate isomerase [Rhodocyclaceae bacterium]MCA3020999.1 2-hydroxychromene-2-carboxylate isomerase [Rhodocyclaceae bacterium]MCA3051799.1 2-hydroxychromene-2-carboxylate isomerase [Rhodocyclaceae bacterium]MCA3057681.1 2-hydroxychromene-2-carboxylate isomerase [Rhodocyclaceae bacterium]